MENLLKIYTDKQVKPVDCIELSEHLASELFKSPLNGKVKIVAIELCFGSSGSSGSADNKFSLKIEGKIGNEDIDEVIYLKERFYEITQSVTKIDKKEAQKVIDHFWEVKLRNKFDAGEKFNVIENCFNQYGNKQKVGFEPGRVMLIDIWATWCRYCHAPMDENVKIFNELSQTHPNVDIIAISCDSDNDHNNWKNFVRMKKWGDLQHYRNRDIMATVGLQSIPHILIVDTNGIITYSGYPGKVQNLRDTLINLSEGGDSGNGSSNSKQTAEQVILTREDPNPQWGENPKEDRDEIVNTINDIILGKGINTVKFVVSTKILYFDGKRKTHTQPIFSGTIMDGQFEAIQEIGIMVSEDFGLKDVQYNVKLLNLNNANLGGIDNSFNK